MKLFVCEPQAKTNPPGNILKYFYIQSLGSFGNETTPLSFSGSYICKQERWRPYMADFYSDAANFTQNDRIAQGG